ncbi:hypothetical protein [Cellulosimicrobium sp. NPDC057127]|uniref:hypothetical protein n=1 Tax=Cellulosimicrobium sp. NPDC057127 TaxID=3346026 RepID=UPI00362F4CDE
MSVSPRPAPGLRAVRPAVVAGVVGVLLLGACSGGADGTADPAPSDTPTSTATGTASPEGTLTVQEACSAMYVDGDTSLERRVVAALVDISEGADTDSVATMTAVGIELGSLSVDVPAELADAVDAVRVPFLQLQENLDAGTEPSVELDVASARAGLTEYREVCDAAGGPAGDDAGA